MVMDSFSQRQELYKKLCSVMDSPEFCDDDPEARKQAKEIQKQIEGLDRDGMSPRQRLRAEITDVIGDEPEQV
jgi:hypothetical protein